MFSVTIALIAMFLVDGGRPCADEAPANASAQRVSIHRGEKRRWANLRHVNGVAVYQEHAEQSGAGGAFMVSAVVRATPKACFKVGPMQQQGADAVPACM